MEHNDTNARTVQIPLNLRDDQDLPTRMDFQAVFELLKRPGTVVAVTVDYVYAETNMPYLDRHPDDPLHTTEKRELFVELHSEEEADFVKRQEWTLFWKYGPTTFKPIKPKHNRVTRDKLREIGRTLLTFKRVTQELLDLGAIYKVHVVRGIVNHSHHFVFALPDYCVDALDFDSRIQIFLKDFNEACTANDKKKQDEAMGNISHLARTTVKVNKGQLLKDIKSRGDAWHALLFELIRINQSETYFTFKRSFPSVNPKWTPIEW